MLPAAADKLLLLPNGYNEDIFYREEVDREAIFDSLGLLYRGEYIVLFAGKLAAFKGVDTLLRVARRYERLAERGIITLIAGDGEERERLSELHKQLGLRNTFFLGNQRQDELRRLYNTADVFVMPSRREPSVWWRWRQWPAGCRWWPPGRAACRSLSTARWERWFPQRTRTPSAPRSWRS